MLIVRIIPQSVQLEVWFGFSFFSIILDLEIYGLESYLSPRTSTETDNTGLSS